MAFMEKASAVDVPRLAPRAPAATANPRLSICLHLWDTPGTIRLGGIVMAMVAKAPAVLGQRDGQRSAAASPRLGFLWRRFGKWIALSHYGFPFSIGRYATPVGRFRALARRTRFAWMGPLRRTPLLIAMTLGWPVGAFTMALKMCKRMRKRGQDYGLRQFVDMYWLALRHSIPPLEYALYRFDEPERRKDMHEYVYWNDLVGLDALIARCGADNRDVQDKDRFTEICARHGLPHVPTLAVFDRGRQVHPAAAFVPDVPVLWVKSLRLNGGAGGAKWIRTGNVYCNAQGRRVSALGLTEEFRRQDCLVQPFVENHPEIAPMSNGALASLRIVTGLDERGQAEFVTSLMGLPQGARETSVAGVSCGIDPETGRVRTAESLRGEPVIEHPDTGARIIGIQLPFWHESIDLVRRAHAAAFARFPFLGWDVALTADGPILLETNSGWGAIFHQAADGPLGRTAFSRLVGQYV